MKSPHRRTALLGGILAVVVALFGLLPAAVPSALAATTIQTSRSFVAPGDSFTIGGSGFQPGDTAVALVPFIVANHSQNTTASTRVAANGTVSLVLTVPANTTPGAYPVTVRDFHNHQAIVNVIVLPEVAVQVGGKPSAVTVVAGHQFVVTGAGFTPGEKIQVSATFPQYNGNAVTVNRSAVADKNGRFGAVQMNVPFGSRQDNVTMTATGLTSGKKATATVSVVYRPSITVDQKSAVPGTSLSITGSGFVPNGSVHVTVAVALNSGSNQTLTTTSATDQYGRFTASIALPSNTKPGSYTVTARGSIAGMTASAPVSIAVHPVVSVQPGTSLPGQAVRVTGAGFSANAPVTVTALFPLGQGKTLPVASTLYTNSKGEFSTQVTVPQTATSGTTTVTAKGPSGQASTHFMVGQRTVTLTLQQKTVQPGGSFVAMGSGFAPKVQVTVIALFQTYGGGSQPKSVIVITDTRGAFATRLAVPRNAAAGTVTVVAKGPHSQTNAALTVGHLLASVSASPTSVIPGSSVSIKGSGYLPNDQVTISLPISLTNGAQKTLTATATTGGQGQFVTSIQIPANANTGTFALIARSVASGRAPSTKLSIVKLAPSVVVTPNTAMPGAKLTVNGFGFAAGQRITLTLGNQNEGTVVTDAAGKFASSITIPGGTATGTYTLGATSAVGRKASVAITVNRTISTHFYFASEYTGKGYLEYLAFLNPTVTPARVTITYQRTSGTTLVKTFTINPHSRYTQNVNGDLGYHVSASAAIASDVAIAVERLVYHYRDGAVVPGVTGPSTTWYFANGNTSHQYREYIAVQNPNTGPVQIAVHFLPTHHAAFTIYRNMAPTSRTTIKVNSYVKKDAVGVIVTANGPIVANRTIFIRHGMNSKMGLPAAHPTWYFASGPGDGRAHNWIAVINPFNRPTYVTVHTYGSLGQDLGTARGWVRPFGRKGYLINHIAHQTDTAVVVTASQPIISEQTTYVTKFHDASTDTFGVPSPGKSWAFAVVNTVNSRGERDVLNLFNPGLTPTPIVVQFFTNSGSVTERTYIVGPLSHQRIDVGSVAPNAQLGILTTSNAPFVALNRNFFGNDGGSMTSSGIPM